MFVPVYNHVASHPRRLALTWNVASKRRLREKLLCCRYIHCYVSCELGGPKQLRLDYEFLLIVRLKIYKWVEKYHNLPLHPCNSGADYVNNRIAIKQRTAVSHTDRQHLWEASGSRQECRNFQKTQDPPQNSRCTKGWYEASSILRTHSYRCHRTKVCHPGDLAWGFRESPAHVVHKNY
jgi:hypothetical protein